uniref:Uncharacterized protein n=1 Tax=Cacopsylla melanoneura TaxID=428564 RepID=A0A8D8Q3F0_9HEMI
MLSGETVLPYIPPTNFLMPRIDLRATAFVSSIPIGFYHDKRHNCEHSRSKVDIQKKFKSSLHLLIAPCIMCLVFKWWLHTKYLTLSPLTYRSVVRTDPI